MDQLEQLKKMSNDQLIQRVLLLSTKLKELESGSKELCEKLSEQFKEQKQRNDELEALIKSQLGLDEIYDCDYNVDESLLTKLG